MAGAAMNHVELLKTWLEEVKKTWDICCNDGVSVDAPAEEHKSDCIVRRTLEALEMKSHACGDCKFHPSNKKGKA